jgi:4-hydroxy-3-polyprenylbenzoate decarboxylase
MSGNKRLVVGISGASGVVLGIRLLEELSETDWEVHLILTDPAKQVIETESGRELEELYDLATRVYGPQELQAPMASGSFTTEGMAVVPCSMKTLAGIAAGYADNLLLRAADVCLKERRKLVLVPRETPLSLIHLENMRRLALAGATLLPPVITMYTRPRSIDDLVDQIVGKVLDALGIDREAEH